MYFSNNNKQIDLLHTLCNRIAYINYVVSADSFLRMRNTQDHEATAMMKAQFMSLWDGLITDPNCVVIVMGATNRPRDLDQAIMRRMPSMFHVSLPVRTVASWSVFLESETHKNYHMLFWIELEAEEADPRVGDEG